MDKILCIAGPTASGKTALSIALAQELGAEIVSCDSMQVYRGMDIGTAKPTLAERQGIPHHMLDVCDPRETYSVSRYCAQATPILENLLAQGKPVIVVGGTGLYMDHLMKGTDFAPFPSTGRREALEAQADAEGGEAMHKLLASIDPEAAGRISPADRKRVLRALEIYYETGETLTEHDRRTQAQPPRFSPLWLGLDFPSRGDLYRRVDLRVDAMLQAGLLEEIQSLLAQGIPETATAMQAIGYKEFVDALEGRCTLAEAADRVKQSSRRYAKRQLTWFRRNKAMHWLLRGPDPEEILAAARLFLRSSDIGPVVK